MYSNDNGGANRVITNVEICNSGITNLSDLFYLIDEWTTSSIDGYRNYASASGWNTFNNQDWMILLNGSEMDVKFMEYQHINLLPISVNDIDKIEIINSPMELNGVYIKRGAINIITKRSDKPLSVSFMAGTGNETGDPGPYKYTGDQSPNVDQVGPDYAFGASGKLGNLSYLFSGKYHIHTSTDPKTEFRNSSYPWALKQSRQFSYYSEITYKDEHQKHSISFGKSKIGKLGLFSDIGADLFFLGALGKEFHSDTEFNSFLLCGNIALSDNVEFGYNTSLSSKSINPISEDMYQLDFVQDSFHGGIFLNYMTGNIVSSAGYSFKRKEYYSSQLPGSFAINKNKFYLESSYQFTNGFKGGMTLDLQNSDSTYALSMDLSLTYDFDNSNRFVLSVGKTEVTDDERNDTFYLNEIGINAYSDFDLHDNIYENIVKDKLQYAELHWTNYGETYNLKSTISYKSFSNYPIVKFLYNYSEEIYLEEYERLLSGGSSFMFSTRFNKDFSIININAFYAFTSSFDEHNLMWNEIVSIPNHNLSVTTTINFASSFVFWAKLKYQSETEWKNTLLGATELKDVYSTYFDNLMLLDCGIRKSLLDGKISFNLIVKNIFSDYHVTHPFGSVYNTSIYVKLELNL